MTKWAWGAEFLKVIDHFTSTAYDVGHVILENVVGSRSKHDDVVVCTCELGQPCRGDSVNGAPWKNIATYIGVLMTWRRAELDSGSSLRHQHCPTRQIDYCRE